MVLECGISNQSSVKETKDINFSKQCVFSALIQSSVWYSMLLCTDIFRGIEHNNCSEFS